MPTGVPCFADGCYARSAYNRYPNVRTAWNNNLALWQESPQDFESHLHQYMNKFRAVRFRFHVGGDIPDEEYLSMMRRCASKYPSTQFLTFTKRYNFDYKELPSNLVIVLSAWPGLDFEENSDLPTAWLAEDPRAPLDSVHIHCPGGCNDCGYQCWTGLAAGMSVIFDKH